MTTTTAVTWKVLLALFVAVALWEGGLAVLAPRAAATLADWQTAAEPVRAGFRPGDLIVFAPAWADQVGRSVLGDLMPVAMVGRPDAARYARIWELSIRGARSPDTAGLQPEWQASPPGPVHVARYAQRPLTVTYDLVDHYLEAHVTQVRHGDRAAMERPCFYSGSPTGRGEFPGFRCAGSKVERRVMEIDYQPRYGVVVPAEAGQDTRLSFRVPAEALRGATLWLWAGLHDYYARKTESGGVAVSVALEETELATLHVTPEGGWQRLQVPLPAAGAAPEQALRISVFAADARARNLGFAAELRR